MTSPARGSWRRPSKTPPRNVALSTQIHHDLLKMMWILDMDRSSDTVSWGAAASMTEPFQENPLPGYATIVPNSDFI